MTLYILRYFWDKITAFGIFIWIICFCEYTYTSEIRQMIWAKDDAFKDLTLSTGFLWQRAVRSRLKCSITCTDDSRCGAFFFSDSDKSCLASSYLLNSPSEGTALAGAEYYFFRPDNCPASYIYSRKANLCIKLFSGFNDWNTAKTSCESVTGGGLVAIRNQDQFDFVADEVQKASLFTFFFVDGTDAAVEGTYILKDGSELSFFNWAPTKPDAGAAMEDCLVLDNNSPYKLSHDSCSNSRHHICEIVV